MAASGALPLDRPSGRRGASRPTRLRNQGVRHEIGSTFRLRIARHAGSVHDMGDAGTGAVGRQAAQHRLHHRRRPGLEGCRLPRLRHQDAEHRRAGARRHAAGEFPRAAPVHADTCGADDRSLSLPHRHAERGDSLGRQVRPGYRRVHPAAGAARCRLLHRDDRQMAYRPCRPEILAAAARLRLPLRRGAGRDRLFHPWRPWRYRLVSQQRAGEGRRLRHRSVRRRRRAPDRELRRQEADVHVPGLHRAAFAFPGAAEVPGPERAHRRADPAHLRRHDHRPRRPGRSRGCRPESEGHVGEHADRLPERQRRRTFLQVRRRSRRFQAGIAGRQRPLSRRQGHAL